MDYKQATDILEWWSRQADTLIIRGTNGHIYDIFYGPLNATVQERWLGSNVYEAAAAIMMICYCTNEPTPLVVQQVMFEGPSARQRFGLL